MTKGAKIKAVAAALAVALMPGAARADFMSTIEMMDRCKPLVEAQILPESKAWISTSKAGPVTAHSQRCTRWPTAKSILSVIPSAGTRC